MDELREIAKQVLIGVLVMQLVKWIDEHEGKPPPRVTTRTRATRALP